jgi:hypothetical protein
MAARYIHALLTLGLLMAAPAICAEPEFVIQIRDHRFVPAELNIPTGVQVRIILDNQDDTPEEFDSYQLNREKHVPPKSRLTLFVGPLGPGRYLFECENSGNAGGPAIGILVVR